MEYKAEKMPPFGQVFFRLYDSKIAAGVITFSQMGMSKSDFTRLCTDADFVPERRVVEMLCHTMKLTSDEAWQLLCSAGFSPEVSLASAADLSELMEVEKESFPEEEAAEKSTFAWRMEHYAMWMCKAVMGDRIAAYISGRPVGEVSGIEDWMYGTGAGCDTGGEGRTAALLSLAVREDYRGQGIGSFLLDDYICRCREKGMNDLILACREERITYYERFGFVRQGISSSVHGGSLWNDMKLQLT